MSAETRFDPTRSVDFSVVAGKTAIVTGGASGIGLGVATALAKHGAHVAVLDIDEGRAGEAETQLREQGLQARFIETDVTSWEAQHSAFEQVLAWSQNSRIDIVVASAGVVSPNIKHVWLPPEDEALPSGPSKPPTPSIDINLLGTYYTTHLALSSFVRQSPSPFRPQVLFISALSAYLEQEFNPDYAASNSGIRAVFKSVRHAASNSGNFQANMLVPTFVSTPLIADLEDMLTWRGAKVASVEDVVDAGMRCVCNGLEGRAICIVKGKGGLANFDVEDDVEGGSGVVIGRI